MLHKTQVEGGGGGVGLGVQVFHQQKFKRKNQIMSTNIKPKQN
jgi:hypothetical protein